ncbi:MAG: PAS domain-containing protein [Rouxiella aceris]|uniref:helix-turn-helix transcriptional regulator n=1 Tax=Rouxiella aceris TaxID=2703884 RepID=UPI00284D5F25|nr:PAS domain-containing protein [Rouxiella aceris]MDR3431237.1 PAS domain-containing protein [Rouxiella aceris]
MSTASGANAPQPTNYQIIADSIATLLFPHAEVVLHDLKTQRVVHIANNLSRRKIGDDSALDELPGDAQSSQSMGPYEKLNWDGQRLRSITSILRDAQGQPVMALCINLNFSVLEQARDALNLFFQSSRIMPQPEALFRDDWQERINTFLHSWLHKNHLGLNNLRREEKRQLVEALYHERAFEGRSAVDYVASVLSMGRATVYKYVKALREES